VTQALSRLKCQEMGSEDGRTGRPEGVSRYPIRVTGTPVLAAAPLRHRRRRFTERQFTSLQTAYYGGYFETPRKSIGDELAERLGITRQTFNRHLRLAENTVLEQLFEGSGKGRTLTSQPDSLGRRCSCPEVMTSSTILTDSTDRFGYDTIAETYHAQYDWTSDSPPR